MSANRNLLLGLEVAEPLKAFREDKDEPDDAIGEDEDRLRMDRILTGGDEIGVVGVMVEEAETEVELDGLSMGGKAGDSWKSAKSDSSSLFAGVFRGYGVGG